MKTQGYFVQFRIDSTRTYANFTSPRRPLNLNAARSYQAHLERQHSAGRVVDVVTGEVMTEWEGEKEMLQIVLLKAWLNIKYPKVAIPVVVGAR